MSEWLVGELVFDGDGDRLRVLAVEKEIPEGLAEGSLDGVLVVEPA